MERGSELRPFWPLRLGARLFLPEGLPVALTWAYARDPDGTRFTIDLGWMPGHNKSDLAYTIRTHRPDWFLHMFPMSPPLEALLTSNGYRLAPNGHWTRAP
jgi:hypothetical protein